MARSDDETCLSTNCARSASIEQYADGDLKEVQAFHTDRAIAVIVGALLAVVAVVGLQSARRPR